MIGLREIRIITAALAAIFLILEIRKSRDALAAVFLVIMSFVLLTYFVRTFAIIDAYTLNDWYTIIGIMVNCSYIVYTQFRKAERGQ